jgi:PPOX class probable F420-dependent enzyme
MSLTSGRRGDRFAPPEVKAMAKIPDEYRDLFTKKSFAHLATLMPDGSPQVTPVWIDLAGDKIRVNSARGRVKDRNVTKNAKVALSITDPDNPYRHISVRGQVASISEKGADEHIDAMAKKYLGKDKYPFRRPGEVRVIYDIEPTSVSAMG